MLGILEWTKKSILNFDIFKRFIILTEFGKLGKLA